MEKNYLFTGVAPALITPFTADDEIDEPAMRKLIDWQVESGVDALVVLGTTGENATVWPEERRRIVDLAVEHTAGRVPVIIGAGNNSTSESIGFSKEAAASGADALLIVGPYYNKPTQAGFVAHVKAIAEAADKPIILYNVPGRTSFNIAADTVLQLAEEVPSVVGIKEASGDLAQISDILMGRPEKLAVYSGDDEMTLPMIALGAHGVVSVLSNVLPEPVSRMVRTALGGRIDEARRLHFELVPAMRACFVETNPIPVKTVLASMGIMNGRLRLPLVDISEANRPRLLEVFEAHLQEKV